MPHATDLLLHSSSSSTRPIKKPNPQRLFKTALKMQFSTIVAATFAGLAMATPVANTETRSIEKRVRYTPARISCPRVWRVCVEHLANKLVTRVFLP